MIPDGGDNMPDNKNRRFRIPKVGMRSVKTVLAVLICLLIDYIRGVVPFQSTIAAILCIQPDTENMFKIAFNRIAGTLLGGLGGALALTVYVSLGIPANSVWFYIALCPLLFPIIYIPVRLGWPSAAALTCIVFLVVALSYSPDTSPLAIAFERIVDTAIGVLVALPVNLLLPGSPAAAPANSCPRTRSARPPVKYRSVRRRRV